MEALYFGRIDIQVRNYAPEVREFAGLLLELFLNRIRILQYLFVIVTKEIIILLIVNLELFEAIYQLIFPRKKRNS